MTRTRTIQGELLTVAERLKRDAVKVDLVMCSPPYEDARLYGELRFKVRDQAWVDWAVPRFMACLERCNGLVVWVIEGKTRQYRWSATPALFMADLHRRGVCLRKPPIFKRVGIPGSGGPDWLRNDYEFCVCATAGGKLGWSDPVAMGHDPRFPPGGAPSHRLPNGARVNKGTRRREGTGKRETQVYRPPAKANPGNVIKLHGGGGHMGSKIAHLNEAPFPERLCEFFIRSFCRPGGTCWDPFSGSGTTAAVALRHGRNAIASDIRGSQIDLTVRRIAEVRAELAERKSA
jgi:hypothetical protein